MKKPLIRLGVDIDPVTWQILLNVGKADGVESFWFIVETGQPMVWLVYAGKTDKVLNDLHDMTTKRGGLPMKSAGETREWYEAAVQYFAAAKAAERAKRTLEGSGSDSTPMHGMTAHEQYRLAADRCDEARQVLETAVREDARRDIDSENYERASNAANTEVNEFERGDDEVN